MPAAPDKHKIRVILGVTLSIDAEENEGRVALALVHANSGSVMDVSLMSVSSPDEAADTIEAYIASHGSAVQPLRVLVNNVDVCERICARHDCRYRHQRDEDIEQVIGDYRKGNLRSDCEDTLFERVRNVLSTGEVDNLGTISELIDAIALAHGSRVS